MAKAILARAWRDTKKQATEHTVRFLLTGLPGALVGAVLKPLIEPTGQVLSFSSVIYVLGGYAAALLIAALWNLIAAPNRILKDDVRRVEGERDARPTPGTPMVPDMHFRDVANTLAQEAGVPRLIAVQHLRDMIAYQAMRLWARNMSGDSPVQVPLSYWKGNVRFRGKDDYDSDIPDTGVVFLEGRMDGRWQSTHYEPMVLKADFEKVRPILLEKLKDWKSR